MGLLDPAQPLDPTIASKSYFNKVWREDDELKKLVPRAWMPFAKCTICVAHRGRLASSTSALEREQLYKDIEVHVQEVRAEKSLYYDNRERGRTQPKEFMSVIIDGADCSKHELPHFAEASKASCDSTNIKMHVYGALIHGYRSIIATMPDHEAQGHNVTVQMLWQCINTHYREKLYLPKVLLLQLDNTTKQNKGQYLFGFLSLLVERGVFKKVLLSFLPVGHTHEDIDQLFGRFSIYLSAFNACTRTALGIAAEKSFTFEGEPPTVVHWDTVANFSNWVQPYMAEENGDPSTKEVTRYRHFRFVNRKEGPAVQARFQMASDMAEDGWTGLRAHHNHTFVFPSARGIPDLWLDFQRDALPRAQVRESADTSGFDELRTKHLPLLQQTYPNFTADHIRSLEVLMDLYTAPPAKWSWSSDETQFWFDGRHKGMSSGQTGLQKLRNCRAGGFLELGLFYIVDPPAPPREDTKPFWLGRLLRIDPDETHAWMQWMEQDNEDNPITGDYAPFEKAWLRNNDGSGVKTLVTALHECVGMAHTRRGTKNTIMKICVKDQPKAKYWAERFTGKSSRAEEDELPLTD